MVDDRLLGAIVEDSHDDEPDQAVVVSIPGILCDEWEANDEHTVATYPGNEEYPDDAPVVVVVFKDELEAAGYGDYEGEHALDLSELAEQSVPYFAFPPQRLEVVATEVAE